MSKLRAPNRIALQLASTLAAGLLIASTAWAAAAPRTISGDLCDYASNKPVQLQAEINALMLSLGFTGLPPDQCKQFVKSMVSSCRNVAKASTRCSLDINTAVGLNAGEMSNAACDAQTDPADVKSCKTTVKKNTKDNLAVARQTLQQLAERTCKGSFALFMDELCREGPPPPP